MSQNLCRGTITSTVSMISYMYERDPCQWTECLTASDYTPKYLLLDDDEPINSLTQVSESYFIANTYSSPSVVLPWRRRSKTVLPYASQILPHQNSIHPNWNLKTSEKLKVASHWKVGDALFWPMGYKYFLDILV